MLKCPGCGEENPPKFRMCGYCGTPLVAAPAALPAREVRKTVTIVFSDLKGSTALGEVLDPEALHEVKERYFTAMAVEITRHGGKIEKYIGDAIMAVFGLPRAHEDDALRAVRATMGMQAALRRVNDDLMGRYGVALANRTGVNTGEVVASDDPTADQKLATGDAVNVAARLEQAAPENQVYLGDVTYRLVRDAVEVEAVEPLELKGKAQRVPAYRLVAARGLDGLVRRHDRPLVGRDAELATLSDLYEAVSRERAARMVTLIGDAGFGKSRLVHEVIDRIAVGARVLTGRCLPYGDGITFWPLLMMVREAADIRDTDSPEIAQAKLLAAVGDAEVAQRLASAAGLSSASFPLVELNWAARKFFEGWAASAPLVAFIDDIHWAEPAFLDLLEHVQSTAVDAPILLLTTARHDLIEERATWGTQPGSVRMVLKPLSDDASAQVVTNLLGSAGLSAEVTARIVQAAEGNPLYAEQMLSMLIDSGALRVQDDRWVRADETAEIAVPPTIHALLEARLDGLGRPERAAVEPASVIGLEFPHSAVESLTPQPVRSELPVHLATLTRKRFIHPAQSSGVQLTYRFHHHLVRETVYNGLLKRARANLHLEFVRWADRTNADSDRSLEFEEILGYHLEQAHRYLRELGPLDAQGQATGSDAARRLSSAGRRAAARGDMHAAANLYRRAVAVLDVNDPQRWQLLPDLAETLIGVGDFAGAREALDEASGAADRSGDARLKASSRLLGMFVSLYSGEQQDDWSEETLRVCHELIPTLERENAHNEVATAWRLVVLVHGIAGRFTQASEGVAHSIAHARRAGNERLVARNGLMLAINALNGPMPVAQAIVDCEQLLAAGLSDRQVECNVMCALAQLKAMNGELDAARSLYRRSRALLRDLGQGVYAASTGIDLARVELHGGDLALAQREVQADCDFLATKGETYFLSTMAALLARIAREQGRDDEALAQSRTAEEATAADDMESQALWRMVRAPILARAGELQQAEGLARSAVELARRTESPMLQADALAELAAVLALAGRLDEALGHRAEALSLYEAKGNRVMAQRCIALGAQAAR
ncbi:adenylate/guanylate cyclase domain-containing protein [uncultured Piscinibacter sp.]|uniref:adenylate/guanylate cyclase domain-containing protein n=1 Tax=uncultured Piscinibacter sp. TaxID=1131835 RepID=UPI00261998F3|nr:adenylate/guanylate cyclase domain-containing protein [uncultured Piscinibacter sp.]